MIMFGKNSRTPRITHEDFMNANSTEYINSLPESKKQSLIETVRLGQPTDCMECLFFKWIENDRHEMQESCALGYDNEIQMRMKDKLCPVGGGNR
jgi:hypothetical protein